MRIRVYVSGAISKGDIRQNVLRALEAGDRLLKAGYAPMVPHLSVFWGGDGDMDVLPRGTTMDDWLDMDLSWVSVSHAVLRLSGESVGADRETKLADELGIPVFNSVDEILARVPAMRVEYMLERTRFEEKPQ